MQDYILQTKTFKSEIDADLGIFDYQTRYVVCSPDGTVIDDAQGFGYKTAQSAHKAVWYKQKGGKQKMDKTKKDALKFWRKNADFAKELVNWLEINFKDSPTDQEIVKFAGERGIKLYNTAFLKYLPQ